MRRNELDGAAIELSQLEQRMLDIVRQRGPFGFVAILTIPIMAISMSLTVFAFSVLYPGEDEYLMPSVLLSLGIPAVVAPPTFYLAVALTSRLDTATRLLRSTSLTDPLTGVLNRRGFFEAVEEFAHANERFGVAMVDVNRFKQLNDTHGHAAGDAALICVADWLAALAGDDGIVARIGGDEFAIVVSALDRVNLPAHQSLLADGVACSVTIGSAAIEAGEHFDAALARADGRLYDLKHAATPDTT